MDNDILNFIDDYFHFELKQEILRSFNLLESFKVNIIYEDFVDILSQHGFKSNDYLRDAFVRKLTDKLIFILNEHTIKVNDDLDVFQLNELVSSLLLIQDLEDYTGIIRVLESFEQDEEKLSLILSDLCALDQTDILLSLESFNPVILTKLKEFIYSKEKEEEKEIQPEDFTNNLKHFFILYSDETLGRILSRDIYLGLSFENYINYIDPFILKLDDASLALNLLSVLMLSTDGQIDPINIYRKYSLAIVQDMNRVANVEVHLMKFLSQYLEYKKAKEASEVL